MAELELELELERLNLTPARASKSRNKMFFVTSKGLGVVWRNAVPPLRHVIQVLRSPYGMSTEIHSGIQ
jgi:hypothetical protein